METPSSLLAICEENPPGISGSSQKGSVIWKFDVSFVVSLSKLLNTQNLMQKITVMNYTRSLWA